MSDTSLYRVTITDLVSYSITVAATSDTEASAVARTVLLDEVTIPGDLRIIGRTTDAAVARDDAASQAARRYEVTATYSIDFTLPVLAASREEAERRARRLYAVNAGPYEFDTSNEHAHSFRIREVAS